MGARPTRQLWRWILGDWFEGEPDRVYTVAKNQDWTLLGVKHRARDSAPEPPEQAVVETALPLP